MSAEQTIHDLKKLESTLRVKIEFCNGLSFRYPGWADGMDEQLECSLSAINDTWYVDGVPKGGQLYFWETALEANGSIDDIIEVLQEYKKNKCPDYWEEVCPLQ